MSNLPTIENPKVVWVKKAQMWCKTWFEDVKGTMTQRQEWSTSDPTPKG